jgi:ABC-type multidrug transport system fused ATPase/permease subunit
MIQALVRKLGDLAYDVTVGLLKEYKRTSIDLAKIEVATLYLKIVKFIRQECMISVLIVLGAIMFANIVGVLQMAILFYAPWGIGWRIAVALLVGLVAICIPLAVSLSFFSQRRWMEITKADEMLERAVGGMSGSADAGQNGSSSHL